MTITDSILDRFERFAGEQHDLASVAGVSRDNRAIIAAILTLADTVQDFAIELSDVNDALTDIRDHLTTADDGN